MQEESTRGVHKSFESLEVAASLDDLRDPASMTGWRLGAVEKNWKRMTMLLRILTGFEGEQLLSFRRTLQQQSANSSTRRQFLRNPTTYNRKRSPRACLRAPGRRESLVIREPREVNLYRVRVPIR